jgi:hypothetical protein
MNSNKSVPDVSQHEAITKIGNALIDAKVLEQLERFQEDDNSEIHECVTHNMEAIAFIGSMMSCYDSEETQEALLIIESLSIDARNLKKISRP